VRAGQTEGSVDLARLAGCSPAGIVCEIMNEDGTMSRLPQLIEFAREHELSILTVADLIGYRLQEEPQVTRVAQGVVDTNVLGTVTAHLFRNRVNDLQYLALVKGDISGDEPTLVRVHSSDAWTDALTVIRQDGGPQLQRSMRMIERTGTGVVLYILRPFDGESVLRRLQGHARDLDADVPPLATGGDPYPTGLRDYGLGAQVLRELGVRQIRLITNSDRRLVGVEGYGLTVIEGGKH
jgi:3,4-dihydroxy 2-butanone 4-phosphate synthase/GTP cyclohydrolase II